ncbi:MAG: Branched-chain amino acid transport system substrate-binding protein [Candidatus Taylorbacteria bacterium]|nr:Branched-chain amino acid transport system substrate-binding protein [Candidatus Taylorbacteria bacterium]
MRQKQASSVSLLNKHTNMKQHLKIILSIIILIAIAVLIARMPNKPPASIKIGVIVPLSGNVAFLGEGVRNAAMLAQSQLHDTRLKYELIFEDDGFDPKRTASAAQKLISIDKVDAIVTLASSAGNIVNPIAEKNKVIHFAIASDPTIAKGNYNFIHWTPPKAEVETFIKELGRRKIRKIAIFGAHIPGIIAINNEMKRQIAGTEISIVDEEDFNFGETDFKTRILKAQEKQPDIYVLFAFSPELENVTKQLRELGVKTPITAIESFEQTDQPQLYEGNWYVNAADATNAFIDLYQNKYGKQPTLGSANAYDIVGMIANASEAAYAKTGKSSKDAIVSELLNIKGMSGALGDLTIDPEGFVISKAVVRMIRNGKPVTIGQ